MTNKYIAGLFKELADLLELAGENKFKLSAYRNAYLSIRKISEPLLSMTESQWASIPGIGKAIQSKLNELKVDGMIEALEMERDKTPEGILELLKIKGLGPSKIRKIWNDLEITTPGELIYACEENRLVGLSGFGEKTQTTIRNAVQYYVDSKDLFHYATLEPEINELLDAMRNRHDGYVELTGESSRHCNIVSSIDFLIDGEVWPYTVFPGDIEIESQEDSVLYGRYKERFPVSFTFAEEQGFAYELIEQIGPEDFFDQFDMDEERYEVEEEEVFEKHELPYLEPFLRDVYSTDPAYVLDHMDDLVQLKDIRGMVHNHSTWSDGIHSLEQMAEAARALGFGYFVITDHSKSAFYANGLQIERLESQIEEIDRLNTKWTDFTILKGIESDILNNGQLDYPNSLLDQLDVVIASVHSNLRMDKDKATSRLIAAIEQPNTQILGHPTGRLLLSRKGYDIDYQRVIDACAANKVSIEINANPYRLDLDWKWIPYAVQKGVMISINPDAHSIDQMNYLKYGLISAQKGCLPKSFCLNALEKDDFLKAIYK